jgi:hypothetical protein
MPLSVGSSPVIRSEESSFLHQRAYAEEVEQTSEYPKAYQSQLREVYAAKQEIVPAVERVLGTAAKTGFHLLAVLGILNVAGTAATELVHHSTALTVNGLEELLFSLAMFKLGNVVGERSQLKQEARDYAKHQEGLRARPKLSDLKQRSARPRPAEIDAELMRNQPPRAASTSPEPDSETEDFGDWPFSGGPRW